MFQSVQHHRYRIQPLAFPHWENRACALRPQEEEEEDDDNDFLVLILLLL